MIELVSGYHPHTEIYILSYSVRDILGDFSPVVQSTVPVSVQSTRVCQPTERRVKLSSLRATLDWQTSAGWVSDSDNERSPLAPVQSLM